jgi:hypothetical protein
MEMERRFRNGSENVKTPLGNPVLGCVIPCFDPVVGPEKAHILQIPKAAHLPSRPTHCNPKTHCPFGRSESTASTSHCLLAGRCRSPPISANLQRSWSYGLHDFASSARRSRPLCTWSLIPVIGTARRRRIVPLCAQGTGSSSANARRGDEDR